jgi:O-antigen/teichoic acid export membrane protein
VRAPNHIAGRRRRLAAVRAAGARGRSTMTSIRARRRRGPVIVLEYAPIRRSQGPIIAMRVERVRSHSVGARTLRGMFWAYVSYAGLRLSTLVSTAVLARLLTPKDFGVVAVATTVMVFLEMLQGLGVGQALVVAKDDDLGGAANTAFAVSVGIGVVLAALAGALGPVAAGFFHQPQLTGILPVLGSTFLILSLSSTHYALALRSIDFRSRTIAEIGEAVVRGGVGIGLALAGAGVWSLVVGYVAGNVVMTVALWLLVPWRPRRPRALHHLRKLISFGGYVTGTTVMAAFLAQFDNLVVGRALGAAQLGFYSIATKVPYMLILSIAMVAGQVLFPAFATLDEDTLRRGLIAAYRYVAVVVLPLGVFLIVLAKPVISAVFGARWEDAVAAAQVLCLWAMMSPISMVSGNGFMSRGRASLIFFIAVPQAIALVIGSIVFVHDGIVAVSWVQAAIAIVAQIVTLDLARRAFDLPAKHLVHAFVPSIVAAAALALVLFVIIHAIAGAWLAIVAGAVAGGFVYLVVLYALDRELISGARQLIAARVGTG